VRHRAFVLLSICYSKNCFSTRTHLANKKTSRQSLVTVNTVYHGKTQEDRDTELLYRSPNNFLCAAAPLTEPIPDDFLMVSAAVTHAVCLYFCVYQYVCMLVYVCECVCMRAMLCAQSCAEATWHSRGLHLSGRALACMWLPHACTRLIYACSRMLRSNLCKSRFHLHILCQAPFSLSNKCL
jgi:hypothetical protein